MAAQITAQRTETMRKSPMQARAAQTVDAIVEAAIQILPMAAMPGNPRE